MPAGTKIKLRGSIQTLALNSVPLSRFCGLSRSSLPWMLTLTALADIASTVPLVPETSMVDPCSANTRLPAETATWPPWAMVSEPLCKSTTPPVTISTRDRSLRSDSVLRLLNWPIARIFTPDAATSASRWEFSAVSVDSSSGMISAMLFCVSVTLPAASVTAFSRWMVPRWFTEVVDISSPSWMMVRPASVTSPCCAKISPELLTAPLVLPVENSGATSLPRVVEAWLKVVP